MAKNDGLPRQVYEFRIALKKCQQTGVTFRFEFRGEEGEKKVRGGGRLRITLDGLGQQTPPDSSLDTGDREQLLLDFWDSVLKGEPPTISYGVNYMRRRSGVETVFEGLLPDEPPDNSCVDWHTGSCEPLAVAEMTYFLSERFGLKPKLAQYTGHIQPLGNAASITLGSDLAGRTVFAKLPGRRSFNFKTPATLEWNGPFRKDLPFAVSTKLEHELKFYPHEGTVGFDWGILAVWETPRNIRGETQSLVFSAGITTFGTFGALVALLDPFAFVELRKQLRAVTNDGETERFVALVRVPVNQSVVDERSICIAGATTISNRPPETDSDIST